MGVSAALTCPMKGKAMSVSIIEIGIVGICLTMLILTGTAVILGIKLVVDKKTENGQPPA